MSTEIVVQVLPSPECPSGEIRIPIREHAPPTEEGEVAFDAEGKLYFSEEGTFTS